MTKKLNSVQIENQVNKAEKLVRKYFQELGLVCFSGWEIATDNDSLFWIYFESLYGNERFLFKFSEDTRRNPSFQGVA